MIFNSKQRCQCVNNCLATVSKSVVLMAVQVDPVHKYTIILLGASGVGKTSFFYRAQKNDIFHEDNRNYPIKERRDMKQTMKMVVDNEKIEVIK